MPTTNGSITEYRFELLRYVPNVIAGEAFNIGVLLYDAGGTLLDARFAAEFRRLRCHPLVDMDYLHALRNEFEERRLQGEGFTTYVAELKKNLSNSLDVSTGAAFRGEDAALEIERLFASYVATPIPAGGEVQDGAPPPGSRRALRRRMESVFRSYHLFANGDRLQKDVKVNYGSPRLQFSFDYAYPPNSSARYIHGLALNDDLNRAEKLCFVYERLHARDRHVGLTVVLDEGIQEDVKELIRSTEIASWEAQRLDELALVIRGDLGL